MTTTETFTIMTQLQSLELPYAMKKAPHRSLQARDSNRYRTAVARTNYLHARYRKAGKILGADLLHTLGDGAAEILRVIEREEWRELSDVEKCAVGIFHYNLGQDLEIPFGALESGERGWKNGAHFLEELVEWTEAYEREVARPTETGDRYVRVYVNSGMVKMGRGVTGFVRKMVGCELSETMRVSLGIEEAGLFMREFLWMIRTLRRYLLRYLALPRPECFAYESVSAEPNGDGLYNFGHGGFQPWYVAPSFRTIWSPGAVLLRIFGARKPGSKGGRYKPTGYDLMTIGPVPQEGKGLEEMKAAIEVMKSRSTDECPFGDIKMRERKGFCTNKE
ncbi:hypothetical protein B0J11DRAFT_552007 [Dendryphion nanum]|uniref:Uncharacterized protein n=1 Tax=Dendryphion nanum TaxID=256645 RepID=A0A9P9IFI7_9PLEO|nr:hypothetical protein B0J11DRAFT_552007 [Dendryphion nanum]